jgi:hypothetical protein
MPERRGAEDPDTLTERMAGQLVRFEHRRRRWRRWLLGLVVLLVAALLAGGALYWRLHGAPLPP